jgi:phosphoribosylglycinamide formyltransferase-1
MSQPASLVVLISGSGSNLQAIIDQCADKRINASICRVISNKADVKGLARAETAGITTQIIDHTQYADREAFDAALIEVIDQCKPDLVVLAGFMRILTEGFVTHFKGRLINIHPSLLPKYQGLNTHQRAIDAGDSEAGASVHFVTEELDGGPVIAQAKVPVESNDTAEALAKRVLTVEHGIFPVVIGWFADKRIQLDNNQVLFDQKRLSSPIQWPLVN